MKKLILAAALAALAAPAFAASEGIDITTSKGTLTLTPLADNALRVTMSGAPTHSLDELLYITDIPDISAKVTRSGSDVIVALAGITATYNADSDQLTFSDASGNVILSESPHSRIMDKSTVQGEPTYRVEQTFLSPDDECIFGTGQFQDGYLNLRGLPRRLTQVNTQIAIPMVVSNKGYGLIWNNYGLSDFNPSDQVVTLTPSGASGQEVTVDVTSDHGNTRETRRDNTFTAIIDCPTEGNYGFLMDVSQKMARKHKVAIDDSVYVDFNNLWLPPTTSFIAPMTSGKHRVTVEGVDGDAPTIAYAPVNGTTRWSSPVAQALDYTVIAGDADKAISTYRHLTGDSPLLPQWAFGYVHCRERYNTQQQLLENASEFRARQIPIDVIVQDWQWWGKYGWNAMRFDEEKYPDPKAMVDSLHNLDIKLMISVWSKIDKNSPVGAVADANGYYVPGTDWIDFFNPEAAKYYWSTFADSLLLPYHIDAWWQDATEPENDDLHGRRIAGGTLPGEVYRNVYPLLVNTTVYGGLCADDPARRPMILTRSGFSGIQRYGVVTWSGDVGNDWSTLRRQIAGGLGQMAAGLPWWTYDAGGFFRPADQYTNPAYHELFVRWLQTATFLPIMRVHGYMSDTEPWRYGELVDSISRKYIGLRYKLLPYTYSHAAEVAFDGSTLMRPLVFDFASDPRALACNTEYMFGKSILVAPVLESGADEVEVYLPAGTDWVDFWSGTRHAGGAAVKVPVDLSVLPLMVRAGSIIPMAADRQYAAQDADAPMQIMVYPGADGSFSLYEDEGSSNDYATLGAYTRIPISWDDESRCLTIGDRTGAYSGMPESRVFQILTSDGTARNVAYSGSQVSLILPRQ